MRSVLTMTTLAALLLVGCNDEQAATPKEKEEQTAATATEQLNPETEEQAMSAFISQQGTITALNQTADGLFAEATFNDEPLTFLLQSDTPVVTNTGADTTLQVGMNVQGFMYANSPMVMIYPPRYSPIIVVVETEEMGMYSVAAFNDEHVNDTNTLQVNAEQDMPAGHYAVFYTMSTRSIPAQTTPSRIIALQNPFAEATE